MLEPGFVYDGSEYPEALRSSPWTMGYDNEAIQEEFQAAKAMQNLGGSPTPALDQYSRDLTQMAAEANWTCCGKRKGNQQANPDFKPQNQE